LEKDKTAIYDLNNSYFLYEDIDILLDEISDFYDIKFGLDKIEYLPKTIVSNEFHWMSNESAKAFNKLVPKFKSLVKDMYSIIEGVYKSKRGEFKKLELEKEFKHLKALRIFNNKIKHHNDNEAEINLTELVITTNEGNLIDCYINFKYLKTGEFEVLRFSDLIDVFINILEGEKIITIDRK
jgi:hypothetical protein